MRATAWPDPPSIALGTGLLGEIVRTFEPVTEADPAGLLVDLITSYGNAVGPSPYFVADSAKHPPRIFTVLVGDTAKSRKGTSRAVVRTLMEKAEPEWTQHRSIQGLSTGEGLIAALAPGEDGRPKDCRRLVHEPEFARLLRVSGREGSILSPVLRQAWDTGDLAVTTRADPLAVRGAHISIVGHITREELQARLTSTEAANGFANRFLWVLVKRSKLLPSGGGLDEETLQVLGKRLGGRISKARKVGRMRRTEAAVDLWDEIYRLLGEDDPGGLLGAAVSRAEPQVLRLSIIYALADGSAEIGTDHLTAALDLWRYCRESATVLFGGHSGSPHTDQLLEALQRAGVDGLKRTDISGLFGRNLDADRLDLLEESLVESGAAEWVDGSPNRGRPAKYLRIIPGYERNERNELSPLTSFFRNRTDLFEDASR